MSLSPDPNMSPSPQSQLQTSACMILSWLRSAVPLILNASSHPTTKPRKEHPIESLTIILSDAVVLADLVSYLDPRRLSTANVSRSSPRNALSTPLPVPHTTTPIDTRQKSVQYESNTRRIMFAIRKILDDVRAFARTPPAPSGALDAFIGDVTKTPPTRDLRPALRLAEVVIACAIYGPRHNEFRHAIWQFETESLRSAFIASMTRVATVLSLPSPDVLYAPGPPQHSPVASPQRLSPHQSPFPIPHSPPHPFSPQQIFSPPGRVMTPPVAGAPPQPHVTQPLQPFPYPVSPPPPAPRAPVYQKPPLPMSPRATLAPYTATSVRSPIPAAVPPPGIGPSAGSQVRSATSARKASPRRSPNMSRSPRGSSPGRSASTSSSAQGSPRTLPKQAAANPHVNTTSRSVVSPRYKSTSRKAPSPRKALSPNKELSELQDPVKQTSNVTDPDGPADLTRSVVSDTPTSRPQESTQTSRPSHDEGMDLRKCSVVTNESNGSRLTSPINAGTSAAPPLQNLDVQTGQAVEQQNRDVAEMVQRFDEGSNNSNSKRSSEEFYTPREAVSPVPSPGIDERAVQESAQEKRPSSSSPGTRSPKCNTSTEQYSKGRVDEIVRQSVSSSVIKQFTHTTDKEIADPSNLSDQNSSASREAGTTSATSSTHEPESYRSVDFRDPRFMQPSLDAPSPSNQWNMSQRKEVSQGILSPQPLFSPPQMPRRLRRSSAATQMTPPAQQPKAPTLFRSGSMSSKYSHSSTGSADGCIPSAREQEELSKNQKVSFAPVITTPGGRQKPLGEPLNQPSPHSSEKPDQQTQSFSLPPNAGQEEDEAIPPTVGERGKPELTHNELGDDDFRESPQAMQIYDDRDEEGQQEGLPDEGAEHAHLDAAPDSEENFSDMGTFEEVEEYVIYNSDDQTDDFPPAGEDEPRFVREEILASSYELDLNNETEGQTQLGEVRAHASTDRNDREIREAAPRPEHNSNPQSTESEEVGYSHCLPERSSEPNMGTSTRLPQLSRPMSYSTPGYAFRRDVPPTPPSPPAIESLVKSFSEAKRLPDSISSRQVSTMEPSADLFEKLISVWQNTDEDQRTELSQSQIVVEGLPNHAISSDPPASQSTQDSTLRSGDTGSQSHDVPPSPSGSRSRRPRAVRLPEGLKSPQHLSSSFATREGESKSPEVDKTSVASFSDAFSSDDKDHPEEATEEWEAAMKGHRSAGVPTTSTQVRSTGPERHTQKVGAQRIRPSDPDTDLMPPSPSMVQRKTKSHSTSTAQNGMIPEDHLVKVDRRRLDWLTRQLLAARDAISRKELQMTFAKTERAEQREILLLEKQDAESVVDAMKKLLAEREAELQTARDRLSVAIEGVARDRSSAESKTSAGGDGQGLHTLISEGHTKLHEHIDRSETKQMEASQASNGEVKQILVGLQQLLAAAMTEMTEKRDAELEALKSDLKSRERLVADLQKSSAELMSQNREIQSETSAIRLEKEKADHRYKMEMSHVSAQVELVNEFSKKLHDNFRETENLRQQVLHYQDKLSQITSTSGVSRRQIKELREAVTRANDECARLRREADAEKRKRMEAIRRAEELEDLRMKDDAAQVHGRYPDRMDRTDSGSFRSHEPVRPAGHNRPGGSGINARYHARNRGAPGGGQITAQNAWLQIKDKISGIITGKGNGSSRRRVPGHSGRRDYSKGGSSQSSQSQSRSRGSPRDDDYNNRSRSGSLRSRSSQGSGSSIRSGPRSGGSAGRRVSPVEDAGQYMHSQPYGQEGVGRIRATDF